MSSVGVEDFKYFQVQNPFTKKEEVFPISDNRDRSGKLVGDGLPLIVIPNNIRPEAPGWHYYCRPYFIIGSDNQIKKHDGSKIICIRPLNKDSLSGRVKYLGEECILMPIYAQPLELYADDEFPPKKNEADEAGHSSDEAEVEAEAEYDSEAEAAARTASFAAQEKKKAIDSADDVINRTIDRFYPDVAKDPIKRQALKAKMQAANAQYDAIEKTATLAAGNKKRDAVDKIIDHCYTGQAGDPAQRQALRAKIEASKQSFEKHQESKKAPAKTSPVVEKQKTASHAGFSAKPPAEKKVSPKDIPVVQPSKPPLSKKPVKDFIALNKASVARNAQPKANVYS